MSKALAEYSQDRILLSSALNGPSKIEATKNLDGWLAELVDLYVDTMCVGRSRVAIVSMKEPLKRFALFVNKKGWVNRADSSLNLRLYAQWVEWVFTNYNGGYPTRLCVGTGVFVRWLSQNGYIKHIELKNAIRIPRGKPAKPRKLFTYDEYKRLLEAAKVHRHRQMVWPIICGWHTGASMGDVCMLKWASVDLENLVITYGRMKSRSIAKVPILPGSELHLALQQKAAIPNEDVYPNEPEQGVYFVDTQMASVYINAITSSSMRFSIWFRQVMTMAGVDQSKSFHSFRATFASMCANGGVNTALACTMTGHRSPDVFKRYVTTDINYARAQLTAAYIAYHGINPTIEINPTPEPKQLTK